MVASSQNYPLEGPFRFGALPKVRDHPSGGYLVVEADGLMQQAAELAGSLSGDLSVVIQDVRPIQDAFGERFDAIHRQLSSMVGTMGEVQQAAEDQKKQAQQINEHIRESVDRSQEVGDITSKAGTEASELNRQAAQVQQLISGFRLYEESEEESMDDFLL